MLGRELATQGRTQETSACEFSYAVPGHKGRLDGGSAPRFCEFPDASAHGDAREVFAVAAVCSPLPGLSGLLVSAVFLSPRPHIGRPGPTPRSREPPGLARPPPPGPRLRLRC